MTLFDRWTSTLDQLRGQGRYRQFALPRGLDFTSNDYLSYGARTWSPSTKDPQARSGLASRLLRGHHEIWDRVEAELAAWHGAETALMMTSGYAANEGLISTIVEPADWVASDERNHACIVDGLRLARCRRFAYRHNDLNQLEDGLKTEADKGDPDRARFVVTESLFSMDGDRAPLLAIANLAERYGAHLIVDEAHATGCFGRAGAGLVDDLGLRSRVLASVHTGGKALGSMGAYIASNKLLREYLTNRCRHLIFTTALPAAVGAWWAALLPIVQSDGNSRLQLHENSKFFRNQLERHGVSAAGSDYVVPIIIGEDAPAVRVASALQSLGFDVRAIRPPSVAPGSARLRISIHANHDIDVLGRLAHAVAEALRHA
jgi:8-amino-7-oxononanoate synthase